MLPPIGHSGQSKPAQSAPRSWAKLVSIEPRLIEVERLTRGLPSDRDWKDWEIIKAALSLLTGDKAIRPELRAVLCYNVAYSFLLSVFEKGKR